MYINPRSFISIDLRTTTFQFDRLFQSSKTVVPKWSNEDGGKDVSEGGESGSLQQTRRVCGFVLRRDSCCREYRINNSYAICYKNLLTEDESHALIEVVGEDELRPAPPKVHINTAKHDHNHFVPFEVVDAFDNDGWWVGKIIGKQGSSKFLMFMGLRFRILLLCWGLISNGSRASGSLLHLGKLCFDYAYMQYPLILFSVLFIWFCNLFSSWLCSFRR